MSLRTGKPCARKIPLVYRHWSGKHHDTVKGINLLTLLWTDGDKHVPCDHRIYDKPHDGLIKNDHFKALLKTACERGFRPQYVCFDSWFSSPANLRFIRHLKWHWFTRLKSNRLASSDKTGNVPVAYVDTGTMGRVVHLKCLRFHYSVQDSFQITNKKLFVTEKTFQTSIALQ